MLVGMPKTLLPLFGSLHFYSQPNQDPRGPQLAFWYPPIGIVGYAFTPIQTKKITSGPFKADPKPFYSTTGGHI